jgi:hypothetical protein
MSRSTKSNRDSAHNTSGTDHFWPWTLMVFQGVVPSPYFLMSSSWGGVSTAWGYQTQPSRPIFHLLHSSPEKQRFLSYWWRLGLVRLNQADDARAE